MEDRKDFARDISREVNDALNEQQLAVNKAYEAYMDKLDEICTKYGIISGDVMSVAQQNRVSALVDYTLLLRRNCELPVTPSYEANAHRRCLIDEIKEQNKIIADWIHLNKLHNTH